jgi:flagellar protein FlaG
MGVMIMSISRISEKTSQPLVNSFESSQDRPPMAQDVKNTESVNKTTVSTEDIKGELEKLNKIVKIYSNKINFDIDQKTNQIVVKIVDGKTDKIIRQIPPEEIINLSMRMDELKGMIFDDGG